MEQIEEKQRIAQALEGNRESLESLLLSVSDLVFNLSLRMLGTTADAQDASQDIYVKIMTNLSTFRGESRFSTWVYRIASNYLLSYKKSMFAQRPLSFEYYAQDIEAGFTDNTAQMLQGLEEDLLAQELKLSCTNVMLQCFDPETRLIFILGTMFHADSRTASAILAMTPENYRQKLSRARRKMAGFLSLYCGLSGEGSCDCKRRVSYAIENHRLDPGKLEYCGLKQLEQDRLWAFKNEMEKLDELSLVFEELPAYRSPVEEDAFIRKLVGSATIQNIRNL